MSGMRYEDQVFITMLLASPFILAVCHLIGHAWGRLRRWARARVRRRLRAERAARMRTPVRQRLKRRRRVLTASPALRRAANDR